MRTSSIIKIRAFLGFEDGPYLVRKEFEELVRDYSTEYATLSEKEKKKIKEKLTNARVQPAMYK